MKFVKVAAVLPSLLIDRTPRPNVQERQSAAAAIGA